MFLSGTIYVLFSDSRMASWNLSNAEQKCDKDVEQNKKPEMNGKTQKNCENFKDCEEENCK